MATTTQETGRHIALVDIRAPDNVRDLDPEHVKALAGSIELQGMLVPVVVRNDGEAFELVAGFHRIAAARSLGLNVVPVVVRDAVTEDADRAVENITSCRRRHDVINADRGVIPMSDLKRPTVRCEPGGEVGIRPGQIQAVRAAADDRLKWGLPLDSQKRARHRQPATRSRFVRCDSAVGFDPRGCFCLDAIVRLRAVPARRRCR
jgi:ParB-like nuclease domain